MAQPDDISDTERFSNPSLATSTRVDDLLSWMTLEEKAAQLIAVPATEIVENGEFSPAAARERLTDGVGQITRIGGMCAIEPAEVATIANEIQAFLRSETRLGVPAICHEECLSGYMGPAGTVYPQSIGMASTWDPDLVKEITGEIRRQLEAIGCHHALSPVLDVNRDARYGRTEETYGEDPYLVSALGAGYISGLQGDDPSEGVSATVKHYVGHGKPEAGRSRASTDIGPRELREQHLFPFEVAVCEAGVESVMNAYNDIDGIPCAANRELLTKILRGEWGFDGVVVSDYFSIQELRVVHSMVETDRAAGVAALRAGLDVELPEAACYGNHLVAAVREGELAESTVDRAVRRVLQQKFRKGLLEDVAVDPDATVDAFWTDRQRSLAREAAWRSQVLLRNDDDLLPLANLDRLAVIGPKAEATRGLLGDYAWPAHKPDQEIRIDITSPLEGVREAVDEETTVEYEQGCTVTGPSTDEIDPAADAASRADITIAFVGGQSGMGFSEDPTAPSASQTDVVTSGEAASRSDLGLPGVQKDLLEALAEADTPIVPVVISGRPLAIEWVAETFPAIIYSWLPGQEGGHGIADVLFGRETPCGRLPVSLPRSVGHVPTYYNRKSISGPDDYIFSEGSPVYTFGHGLSYTSFEYGNVDVAPASLSPSGEVTVETTVSNVGDRAGREVVQLYISDRVASRTRPSKELKGFETVALEPGETKRVEFRLSAHQLAFYDENIDLVVEPGEFEVQIGHSAKDIRSCATFTVEGQPLEVPSDRQYLTESEATTVE